MSGPTREQVRNLTMRAVRMAVEDFPIAGFSSLKDVEVDITEKYEFIYYLVKFAQEQEREACAKVCDDKAKETFSGQCQVWGDYFARVIRARGNT